MWQVRQRSEFSLGLPWNVKISLVPANSLAGSPAASCSASAWALPGPWQVSHPVTLVGCAAAMGFVAAGASPFQRHQVIDEIVDFSSGMSGGSGGITVPARRSIMRSATRRGCGASQHHPGLHRPLRPGRQSCGSPRTSCRHRSSFPPPPRRTIPAWEPREKWAKAARRSVRSLRKRLGFRPVAARTGLPAGVVARLADHGSSRGHRWPVDSLGHPLRKGRVHGHAKGKSQRNEC